MNDIPRTFIYRLFEIFPGAISWLIIIMPIVASVWFPRAVAIFITLYIVLWFLRSLKLSFFLVYAYKKYKKYKKENWMHLLKFFSGDPPAALAKIEKKTASRISDLKKCGQFKKWEALRHVAIIATYKEEKEILESTISGITGSDFPLEKIIIVLAIEERDRERAQKNADYLKQKFNGVFGGFISFMHPANIAGEVAGKGPNISWSGIKIAEVFKNQNIDFSNVIVTTLDADNRPHKKYFSNLAYHYLMEFNRNKRTYQPVPFSSKNIWEVPVFSRLVALASTFWQLEQSAETTYLRNFSAQAQSLDALVATDFWSRQTIDEDGHQFWRSYFAFYGKHKVVPLFLPIYHDAVQNRTYFLTLKSQYIQTRRWAWGASDIPYVILKMWKEKSRLPFFKSLVLIYQLIEGHIMWSTAPIIITLTNLIPSLFNKEFNRTVFAYNLNQVFSTIFTLALIGILVSIWVSFLTLPPHPRGKKWTFLSMLQWVALPIITIFFGAIPALDAQTRLMLNKPLQFVVTEKIRKTGACAHKIFTDG
ncbi:hypothetical protein HZC21_06530 [Candidatus Peregrinibacteria bacterium]|nr:hypothetical protein [Candidatus Peregrinibacteria bacterium]